MSHRYMLCIRRILAINACNRPSDTSNDSELITANVHNTDHAIVEWLLESRIKDPKSLQFPAANIQLHYQINI